MTNATTLAFVRAFDNEHKADKLVFLLGRACVDDFFEILVLAGSGYGFGALKILRSLYEKAVASRFIASKPELAQDFVDYGSVTQWKLMRSLEAVLGDKAIDPKDREDVTKRYEAIKQRFENEKCDKCGLARYRTWADEDLVTMASQFEILKSLLPTAYYMPMSHTHATAATLAQRLDINDDGIKFSTTAGRDQSDNALTVGHAVLMDVLDLQASLFKVAGLPEALKQCEEDFEAIWNPEEK